MIIIELHDNYKNDSLLIIGIIISLKYNNKKKILV